MLAGSPRQFGQLQLTSAPAATDRRPVDPPPIIDLHVYEGDEANQTDVTLTYRANFCLFASLENARPLAQARSAQPPHNHLALAGTNVAGMSYLERPAAAGYFIFPDLSVRHEGRYRLKFTLFEETKDPNDMDPLPAAGPDDSQATAEGEADAFFAARFEVRSAPFQVFSAKKFPGLAESTALSRVVAEQGCRVRIRRDVRMRRREPKNNKDWDEYEEESAIDNKRTTSPDSFSHQAAASTMQPGVGSSAGHRSRSISYGSNVSMQEQPQRPHSNHDEPQSNGAARPFAPPLMHVHHMPPPAPVVAAQVPPLQMPPHQIHAHQLAPPNYAGLGLGGYEQHHAHHYANYGHPEPMHHAAQYQPQQPLPPPYAYQSQQPHPPSQSMVYSYTPNQHMLAPVYDQPTQIRHHEGPSQYMPMAILPPYGGYGREPPPQPYVGYSYGHSPARSSESAYSRSLHSGYQRPTTPSMALSGASIAVGQPLPPLRTLDHVAGRFEPDVPSNNSRPVSCIPSPYEGHYQQYGPPPPMPPQYTTPHSSPNGVAPKRAYGDAFDTQHINQPLKGAARPNGVVDNGITDADDATSDDDDDANENLEMHYRRADGTEVTRPWASFRN